MNQAFGISEEDTATVLAQNAANIKDRNGRSVQDIADTIQFSPDELDRIEQAALDSGVDMDVQTDGAYAEIKAILIENGILGAA